MTNNENLEELFAELNTEIHKLTEIMQKKATPLIDQVANKLFTTIPEIESVFWTQYTPYFNDGDACTFSVNDIYFNLYDDPTLEDEDIYGEGSVVCTAEDVVHYKLELQKTIEFNRDPIAYREAYRVTQLAKWGRELYSWQNHKPSYQTVEEQQKYIDFAEQFVRKYDGDKINDAMQTFIKSISMVADDIMETLYGDGVRVTITREGTTTDEMEHD